MFVSTSFGGYMKTSHMGSGGHDKTTNLDPTLGVQHATNC